MPLRFCPAELSLGPIACRTFDFTLGFESVALSIVPSVLLLVLAVIRIPWLARQPSKLPNLRTSTKHAQAVYLLKAFAAVGLAAGNLATLVKWTVTEGGPADPKGTAAVALAFVASLATFILSYLEHFRTTRSAMFLPFYVLATLICDIVRIRTLVLTGFLDSGSKGFFVAFAAAFALRGIMCLTENIEKGWIIEELHVHEKLSPEATASFYSRLVFAWATPLLIRGAGTQLTLDNLDPISADLDAIPLWERGNARWQKEKLRGGKHPLVWTLIKAFPSALFAPVVPCVVYSLAQIARPVAIHDALAFIQSYAGPSPTPVEQGWGLGVGFFLIYLIYGICYSWWFLAVNRGASMLRGFLIEAIYRKALVIHVEVSKETGSGKTGSMMSLETEKILLRLNSAYDILNAFIIIPIGMALLYNEIGVTFIASILSVVLLTAIVPPLARNIGPAQAAWSNLTDVRQRLTSSIVRNILPVKLSAYTTILGEKIETFRVNELVAYRKFWIQMGRVIILTNWGTNAVSLITLGAYSVVTIVNPNAAPLGTQKMFSVLAVLVTLSTPLFSIGQGYASMVSAWTSIKRIEQFLLSEEKPSQGQPSPPSSAGEISSDPTLVLSHASFGYKDATFLHDLTTTIPQGKLTMIVGRVGAGKSSLLHACLGEVDLQQGERYVPKARTAYCSQDAWLRSETIRDAIIFASPVEPAWYSTVLRAVELVTDIEMLPRRDETLVTELSGGQRQRVALARAVYSRAERYLLDDVFCALDQNIEALMFGTLFDRSQGLLAGKTVLLATNGVHRLSHSENVIMLEGGRIAEQGTYSSLLESAGAMSDLVRDFVSSERHTAGAGGGVDVKQEKREKEVSPSSPADDEGRRRGVGWPMYKFFGKAVGGYRLVIYALLCIISSAVPLSINIYQQVWAGSLDKDPRGGLRSYFGGYVALELVGLAAFSLFFFYSATSAMPAASRALHQSLLAGVLNAPLAKIEEAGIGKVVNRFSSDLFLVDWDLPLALVNFTSTGAAVVAALLFIIVAAPYVGLIIVGVGIVFFGIQRFYTRTSQQIRRLDLGSKSPLYSLLTDTVDADGIRTVRAFACEEHFAAINTRRVQTSQQPYYLMNVSRRWLNSAINIAVAVINASLVFFAVGERNSTSAGLFAVALIQATSLTDNLNHLFTSWVEVEIAVVAVERIKEFSDWAPEEALGLKKKDAEKQDLLEVWPRQGGIHFKNVSARYRPDLEPALKNLSFKIRAGERVGIVGRTGSGKSTLLAAMFRKIPIDDDGQLIIDGSDIAELPLDVLRCGMSLIPQDPLLLEMSIRDNLSLEGDRSDEEIWAALELSSMKTIVEALPLKLEELVTGSGSFSRGQKQLLALARTLLRKRNIVCLDEATSSIDVETDVAIQRTLRSSFGGATIITVAHRIATIRDYDCILVMDGGRLVEQGSPEELLRIEGGLFRRLVRGDEEAAKGDGVEEIRTS